jgi:DNA-binding NarL/FixJ family response regulator
VPAGSRCTSGPPCGASIYTAHAWARHRQRLLVTTAIVIVWMFSWLAYGFVKALRADAIQGSNDALAPEDLVEAIQVVHSGHALLAPEVTRRVIERFTGTGERVYRPDLLAQLTEREREVLCPIARGLTNTEIAGHLYVGGATVKTHVSRVLLKLGLRDRVQAVVFAYECGLVVPGDDTGPAN